MPPKGGEREEHGTAQDAGGLRSLVLKGGRRWEWGPAKEAWEPRLSSLDEEDAGAALMGKNAQGKFESRGWALPFLVEPLPVTEGQQEPWAWV